MNLNTKTILITGSNGFIGKNLYEKIKLETNYKVYKFDRKSDLTEIQNLISEIDIIFHFAGVNKSEKREDFYLSNEVLTKNICKIASRNKKTKLYYASSTQASLDNEYGKSKKAAEQICLNLEKKFSNKVIIMRLPGIFGKGCKPNYNSVVATFCHNVINDIEIKVFDKNKKIELLYIEDLCDQLITSVKENYRGKTFFEIKNKYDMSILELAEIIKSYKILSKVSSDNYFKKPLLKNLFLTYLSYK